MARLAAPLAPAQGTIQFLTGPICAPLETLEPVVVAIARAAGLISAVLGVGSLLTGCSALPAKSPAQVAADAGAAARVYAALNNDPIYFFGHVDVTVEDGVARLSGVVWSADAVYQARKIARAVPGVTAVDDELELARSATRGGSG